MRVRCHQQLILLHARGAVFFRMLELIKTGGKENSNQKCGAAADSITSTVDVPHPAHRCALPN